MTRVSNNPLRRNPAAMVRQAREARSRAIGNGFRRLWRSLTRRSRPSPFRRFIESTGAAR